VPRPLRYCPAGHVVHVLNRAIARSRIFVATRDFEIFESLLAAGVDRFRVRLLAFCVMPSHWHLVIWCRTDHDVSALMAWVTPMHARQWHADHGTLGTGHVYQDRFKSFVVQTETYLYNVCAYVERNAVRAGLVDRAARWPHGSFRHAAEAGSRLGRRLHAWPVPRPADWASLVDRPETPESLAAIRLCVRRGRPLGAETWRKDISRKLGLGSRRGGERRPKASVP
jgi:putative transposase